MTTIIQVCGCKEVDGETRPFVADTEAEFYGVYIGQNGPPFEWLADFKRKTHAMIFATSFAEAIDAVFDDRTFRKEES